VAAQPRALATRLALTWRAGRPWPARRSLILATKVASSLTVSASARAPAGKRATPMARISPRASLRMGNTAPLARVWDPREGCEPPFGSPAAVPPNRVRPVALRRRVSPGLPFRGFGCLRDVSGLELTRLTTQRRQIGHIAFICGGDRPGGDQKTGIYDGDSGGQRGGERLVVTEDALERAAAGEDERPQGDQGVGRRHPPRRGTARPGRGRPAPGRPGEADRRPRRPAEDHQRPEPAADAGQDPGEDPEDLLAHRDRRRGDDPARHRGGQEDAGRQPREEHEDGPHPPP